MRKFIYQIGNEYYTLEAYSLHDAMVQIAGTGGTVIGDYTDYAHLFGE